MRAKGLACGRADVRRRIHVQEKGSGGSEGGRPAGAVNADGRRACGRPAATGAAAGIRSSAVRLRDAPLQSAASHRPLRSSGDELPRDNLVDLISQAAHSSRSSGPSRPTPPRSSFPFAATLPSSFCSWAPVLFEADLALFEAT
jgi:hypothetical protein